MPPLGRDRRIGLGRFLPQAFVWVMKSLSRDFSFRFWLSLDSTAFGFKTHREWQKEGFIYLSKKDLMQPRLVYHSLFNQSWPWTSNLSVFTSQGWDCRHVPILLVYTLLGICARETSTLPTELCPQPPLTSFDKYVLNVWNFPCQCGEWQWIRYTMPPFWKESRNRKPFFFFY